MTRGLHLVTPSMSRRPKLNKSAPFSRGRAGRGALSFSCPPVLRRSTRCSVILRESSYFQDFLRELRAASHSYTFSMHFCQSIIVKFDSGIAHISCRNLRHGARIAYGLRPSTFHCSYSRKPLTCASSWRGQSVFGNTLPTSSLFMGIPKNIVGRLHNPPYDRRGYD
ncbi:hypothetical protein C7378_2439 [Acidipila rosea]|uniref:Uncharacterized protein n=1 Tax=Acidipila rosea TaxID=768535 RepID=A0A4R1L452_9BACT|nr:hypothetical protein C7378_2439 [Acidipila rosea]